MRFLPESEEEDYSINLPSMTDIIFLLLIFFMVATVLKDSTRRLDVQLPEAHSDRLAEARPLTIEMAADGAISLNGELVTQEQLEQILQPPGGTEAGRSVVIKPISGSPMARLSKSWGCAGLLGSSTSLWQ